MCDGTILSGPAADMRAERETLRAAIERHRQTKRADLTPDQIDPSDERLWAVLERDR